MPVSSYLREKKELVERFLDTYLPAEETFPPVIHRAMRYSLFARSKRLRPVLAIAACEAVGGDVSVVMPFACALELIHTYSLVHDDLPAMDNDDMRRGQPSNHKVFGEGMAVLAGDALLTQAFCLLSRESALPASLQLRILREVATVSGSLGLIGGQVADVEASSQKERIFGQMDAPLLEYIHTHKTGGLIRVALRVGALAGGASVEQLAALSGYGGKVGLAFQIIDDILDIECSAQELGKPQGSDEDGHKLTYPAVWGIKAAREQAESLIAEARADLEIFGAGGRALDDIALYLLKRRE